MKAKGVGVAVLVLAIFAAAAGETLGAPLPESVVDGVREARDWMHRADMALVHEQWLIAYEYYDLVAKVFPNTAYARRAVGRRESLRYRLTRPARAAGTGNSWVGEVWEFLIWP
ncbi:MAG: hypothetical protein HYS41_06515 [Candidatus Omnitrophica bacterium]|nr:hypothetical protein [Candidatus Omnitrophota bacterium]